MATKYKILIVDDEQSITDMLSLQFISEGYYVSIANNAEQALKRLSDTSDIILLDINKFAF